MLNHEKKESRKHKRVMNFQVNQEKGHIPVWMFSNSDEENILSLISDISAGGCGLLISKEISSLPSKIRIRVMESMQKVHEEIDLQIEELWAVENYSIDHKKVGVQFLNINPEEEKKLKRLIEIFSENENNFLRCELIGKE